MPMDQKKNRGHVINHSIRVPQIRVIDSDGNHLGVMDTRSALSVAQEKDLDLVMINDKSEPPVCRIIDYGKFKYDLEKQERKNKKNQDKTSVKELKMRYTIEEHDYQVRVNQAERFLKAGDKVKTTIKFRGRESQHSHLAENLLNRMAKDLQELAEIQQAPKKEGSNMIMLLSPKNATATAKTTTPTPPLPSKPKLVETQPSEAKV
jgi:translation initiation factor IF-3